MDIRRDHNTLVFSNLLASDPLMPLVVATAIRRKCDEVIKEGPTGPGVFDPAEWFACAQAAVARLNADLSAGGILALFSGQPPVQGLLQPFVVTAVEDFGDPLPGTEIAVPEGQDVDAAAWTAAAREAAESAGECEIF